MRPARDIPDAIGPRLVIARLLSEMQAAAVAAACPADLDQHLDGIAAIMENHFRYEEDKLLPVMETLVLDADPGCVLGPL